MRRRKFTFLIIEDNPADTAILRRLLEEIEGWKVKVLSCNKVATGTAEALRGQVDLIFLDYALGGEPGLNPFREIRKEGCTQPVIIFNGHRSKKFAGEAMKSGVSDYLVKERISSERLRLVILFALQKNKIQRKMEEKRRTLLDVEHQRVMMESVTATCHHFAGPITTILANLEMFAKIENIEEPEKKYMFEQCLNAAKNMKMILNKFQHVREYRTRPFLEDVKILDIGLDSIYGTSEFSGDGILTHAEA